MLQALRCVHGGKIATTAEAPGQLQVCIPGDALSARGRLRCVLAKCVRAPDCSDKQKNSPVVNATSQLLETTSSYKRSRLSV